MRSKSLSCGVGRVLWERRAGSACALFVLLTGCATFDQRAGFSDVSTAVEERSGKRVVWNLGTDLDAEVAEGRAQALSTGRHEKISKLA